MNYTICYRDKPDGKVIRNWEKQCFPCEHACLVTLRGFDGEGQIYWSSSGVYLLNCPHVGTRYQKIGKDTWKSQPRARTDIVNITNILVNIPQKELDLLNWQEFAPTMEGWQRTEIAEIPRNRWREFLFAEVPDKPLPCPICNL